MLAPEELPPEPIITVLAPVVMLPVVKVSVLETVWSFVNTTPVVLLIVRL